MAISQEEREKTIAKIEEALRTKDSAVKLSPALYGEHGLFDVLAGNTPEGRMAIVSSDLWRRARERMIELEQKDIEDFERNRAASASRKASADYDPKIGQD